jgi:hypothetical protein
LKTFNKRNAFRRGDDNIVENNVQQFGGVGEVGQVGPVGPVVPVVEEEPLSLSDYDDKPPPLPLPLLPSDSDSSPMFASVATKTPRAAAASAAASASKKSKLDSDSDSSYSPYDDKPPPLPLPLLPSDADDEPPPLPLPLLPPDADDEPPPFPSDVDDEPPPFPLEEQLRGLTKYNQQCWWYFQNERPRLISENEILNAENFRLKYFDYVPVEFQVKSARDIPHIPPPSLYEQIRNLKLDVDSLDKKLQFITRIKRNEPNVKGSTTINFFYKCNITPPSNEKLFDGIGLKGEKIQIPFPAVVFLRCQLSDDGKKLIIHGVYLVASQTFVEIGYPESILKGIVRIESEKSYNKREEKNKPVKMLNGSFRKDELKINAHLTDMYFPGSGDAIERLSDAIHHERNMLPVDKIDDFFLKYGKVKLSKDEKEKERKKELENDDVKEIGNNYALTRFYVHDVDEQKIRNFLKRYTHDTLSLAKPLGISVAKTTGVAVASKMGSALTSLVTGSGGKRKNMKYTMNKIKNIKKRNTKKNKK